MKEDDACVPSSNQTEVDSTSAPMDEIIADEQPEKFDEKHELEETQPKQLDAANVLSNTEISLESNTAQNIAKQPVETDTDDVCSPVDSQKSVQPDICDTEKDSENIEQDEKLKIKDTGVDQLQDNVCDTINKEDNLKE